MRPINLFSGQALRSQRSDRLPVSATAVRPIFLSRFLAVSGSERFAASSVKGTFPLRLAPERRAELQASHHIRPPELFRCCNNLRSAFSGSPFNAGDIDVYLNSFSNRAAR